MAISMEVSKRTATDGRIENVVDRVVLRVSVVPVAAYAVTTALIPWQPGLVAPGIREGPHLAARERRFCSAALKLQTRPRSLCEAADGRGTRSVVNGADGPTAAIGLADGSQVEAPRSHLAAHSSVLAAMVGAMSGPDVGWREQQTGVISLGEYNPAAVRGVLEWMVAAHGVPKQEVAARLLGPELVVETARLCHYLDVRPLLDAALRTVREAVDVENAPSCLLLGRELGEHALEQRAAAFIMEHLEDVAARSDWEVLPPPTRQLLRALAGALQSVPGCAAVAECSDPRELLAMVRENYIRKVHLLWGIIDIYLPNIGARDARRADRPAGRGARAAAGAAEARPAHGGADRQPGGARRHAGGVPGARGARVRRAAGVSVTLIIFHLINSLIGVRRAAARGARLAARRGGGGRDGRCGGGRADGVRAELRVAGAARLGAARAAGAAD